MQVRISAEGALEPADLAELAGCVARTEGTVVVLRGDVADQAAFIGALERLRRAGLRIRDVDPVRVPAVSAPAGPDAPAAVARIDVLGQVAELLGVALDDVRLLEEPAVTTIEVSLAADDELFDVLDRLQSLALEVREVHVRTADAGTHDR